jgi:hypothetical protein
MRSPSGRLRGWVLGLAVPVSILAAAGLIVQSSYAAFTAETRNAGNNWSSGQVGINTDAAGAAMFTVTNLLPGQTGSKCIVVSTATSISGEVRTYFLNPVASQSGLMEQHLLITESMGTGGTFNNCTGYTPATTFLTGATLASLPVANGNYATGVGPWTAAAPTASKTYKISWEFHTSDLTEAQINSMMGMQTGLDFEWEIQTP